MRSGGPTVRHRTFAVSLVVVGLVCFVCALCPYCMVVWVVMIPIFWYVTLHNVRTGHRHGNSRCRSWVA